MCGKFAFVVKLKLNNDGDWGGKHVYGLQINDFRGHIPYIRVVLLTAGKRKSFMKLENNGSNLPGISFCSAERRNMQTKLIRVMALSNFDWTNLSSSFLETIIFWLVVRPLQGGGVYAHYAAQY